MNEWVKPTSKETSYQIGARVLHKGATWENTAKDNQKEPGTEDSGWTLIEKSLRAKALEAYNSEENAWRGDALAALNGVVGEDSTDTMDMIHTEIGDTYHLAIWSDSDLNLSTRKRSGGSWEVRLVKNEDGWTERSESLNNLAELGRALAEKS